jgi:hypothetical protein
MAPHALIGFVAIVGWMAYTYLLVDVAHRQVMVFTVDDAERYSSGTVVNIECPRGRLWVRVLEASGTQIAVAPCDLLRSAWLELRMRLRRAQRSSRKSG